MGGLGSGRHWGRGKNTTSGYLRLDVRWLDREGLLVPGRIATVRWSRNGEPTGNIEIKAEMDFITLSYSHCRFDEPWKREEYPVSLEFTPCNYGSIRPWFRCPVLCCGRRVAILYGGGIFACRHCHGLNYESQHEQPYQRALTRYQKIRVKLGAHAAIGPFPDKPKWMHWRTYYRLCAEAEESDACSWPTWIYRLVTTTV